MSSYFYRDPYDKDRDHLIFNIGIPIHGKEVFYWGGAQVDVTRPSILFNPIDAEGASRLRNDTVNCVLLPEHNVFTSPPYLCYFLSWGLMTWKCFLHHCPFVRRVEQSLLLQKPWVSLRRRCIDTVPMLALLRRSPMWPPMELTDVHKPARNWQPIWQRYGHWQCYLIFSCQHIVGWWCHMKHRSWSTLAQLMPCCLTANPEGN